MKSVRRGEGQAKPTLNNFVTVSMGGPDKLRKIISEIIVLQEVGKYLLKMERKLLYDSSGAKFNRNFI